jgi:hypothetical protein
MRMSKASGFLTLGPLALLLVGCAGTDLKPVASLSASNMMAPSGYSETKISDTQYQVKATGTEATPKTRIEKIARARAAQIGVEQKLKYYKVSGVQYAAACGKKHDFYKGGSTSAEARQTVSIDVVYAKEPLDPTYLSASESFETLNGELSNEVIAPDAKAAAQQEARAGCGQAT